MPKSYPTLLTNRGFVHHLSTVWIVFILSLFVTFCVWYISETYYEQRAQERFQNEVDDDIAHIRQRMMNYEFILHSGVGFLQGSEWVSREEWFQFVRTLGLQNFYPGIQGIGFSMMLRPEEVAGIEQKMRTDGDPSFKLYPEGVRDQYSAILYLEPQDERNLRAIGYDMLSEPIRAEAMERARDTGQCSISGPLQLVQELDSDIQTGILMYLPLYKKGAKIDTHEERRQALIGYVYSPFRMNDLMNGILHNEETFYFDIHDGNRSSNSNFLYQSFNPATVAPSKYQIHTMIRIGGRTWYLTFASTPKFEESVHSQQPLLLATAGVIFDFILLYVLLSLSKSRKNLQIKSDELESHKNRLATLLESSSDGIHILSLEGDLIQYSDSFIDMLGYTHEEASTLTVFDWDAQMSEEELRAALISLKSDPIQLESRNRRKDGTVLDVEITAKAIRLDGENYIYCSSRDITERNKHNKQLEKTTRLLQEAQHLTQLGSWQLDLLHNILEWSDEIYQIFEIDKTDNPPSYDVFLKAIHPDDREMVNTAYISSLEEHTEYTVIHRLLMKDGRIKYVQERGEHFYDHTGKPIESRGTVHDITELVISKNTIEKDRERFRAIADLGADWYWETDEKMRYTFVSPNVEKTLGYTPNEVLGKTPFDFLTSQSHPIFKKQLHSLMSGKTHFNDLIVTVHTKGKREMILETSAVPIVDEMGELRGYRGIDRDITSKKQLESKLIEQNTELQTIFSTSKDGIIITDLDGNFLDCNEAYLHLSGYSKEELLRKTCFELTPSNEINDLLAKLSPLLKDKDIAPFEKTSIAKDGQHHTVTMSIALMPDRKRILATVKDITLQKAKADELAETYDRLRLATDAAGIGIWIWNLQDNSLTWDEKMFRMYEIPEKLQKTSLTYDHWRERCHPEDLEQIEYNLQFALNAIVPFDMSFRILLPDGRIKYSHSKSVVKYDDFERPLYMIGINRDITVEKTFEKNLIEAKESAEQANRGKSDFLANMSHEIRTPLNGIVGLVDLVLQSDLNPKQRDYLHKADISAKVLLHVVNDILDYSKIEAGMFKLENAPFRFRDIISTVDDLLGYKAEEKSLRLYFDLAPDLPDIIYGDSLRLSQILINLVGNALKFTEIGSVTVQITGRMIGERCEVLFSVTDTGIGISSEQQQKLFQPFSQADTSYTRKYGGTGLGLIISKQLIELMDGVIGIESIPDQGSTFSFTAMFNLSSDRENPQILVSEITQSDKTANPLSGLEILLVEDNEINQLVASERLQQMGLNVTIANNGLEAVNLVKNHSYDAVLMDLQMPVMDGLEATKEIRRIPRCESLPIIALSAAVMEHDRVRALEAGMNAHIGKPIDKTELITVLHHWIKPVDNG